MHYMLCICFDSSLQPSMEQFKAVLRSNRQTSILKLIFLSPRYQIVHRTAVPSALAVDWIGKNLYWCDAERKTLEVSKANGLYPTILISSGLKNPSDLALDPQAG